MIPVDTHFLAHERQDHLLSDAASDRLTREVPHAKRPGTRERMAGALIALALRIAPSLSTASHEPTLLVR